MQAGLGDRDDGVQVGVTGPEETGWSDPERRPAQSVPDYKRKGDEQDSRPLCEAGNGQGGG